MSVFQKLGIRKTAIYIVDFITWVRQYGFRNGRAIFKGLQKPQYGQFILNSNYFKNPIILRDNFSDPAIFNQVFYQRQYYFEKLFETEARYIVDAGANIGTAAIYFSNVFPQAEIVSLEPEGENFKVLKQNVRAYSNIRPLEKALWWNNDPIQISNPESLAASFTVESSAGASIPALTVPALLEELQWPRIDILKMDIEGAEKEIFSAPSDWLRRVNVLIIELHDNYKPGATKTFFRALEAYEYEACFNHENIFIFFKKP